MPYQIVVRNLPARPGGPNLEEMLSFIETARHERGLDADKSSIVRSAVEIEYRREQARAARIASTGGDQ